MDQLQSITVTLVAPIDVGWFIEVSLESVCLLTTSPSGTREINLLKQQLLVMFSM